MRGSMTLLRYCVRVLCMVGRKVCLTMLIGMVQSGRCGFGCL